MVHPLHCRRGVRTCRPLLELPGARQPWLEHLNMAVTQKTEKWIESNRASERQNTGETEHRRDRTQERPNTGETEHRKNWTMEKHTVAHEKPNTVEDGHGQTVGESEHRRDLVKDWTQVWLDTETLNRRENEQRRVWEKVRPNKGETGDFWPA